jgi:hypothetical protein
MLQRACLRYISLATLGLAISCFAQTADTDKDKDKDTEDAPSSQTSSESAQTSSEPASQEQAALNIIEQVVVGSRNLSLPQNRIAIESQAFPILWSRNEAQARALVNQIVSDFAQAASQKDEDTVSYLRQLLSSQRQSLVQAIAQQDADLALTFLAATRSYVRTGDAEEEEAEERQLRLAIASHEATRNPQRALQAAEKELERSGDIPSELLNLLSQVEAKDPQAGAQLFKDIVRRVKSADLSSGDDDFGFALNLMNAEFFRSQNQSPETQVGGVHDTLKTLAEAVAAAALSPQFPEESLSNLQAAAQAFEQLTPGQVQAIRRKVKASQQSVSPQQSVLDEFNQAQAGGSPDQLLALAARAPDGVRSNLYQQIVMKVAADGDYERTRQIAENLPNPLQRRQVLEQALQQATWAASNRGQYADAWQLARQITREEDRATTLAQIGLNAANAGQKDLAQQIMEEACSLLAGRPESAWEFSTQLQVAQAFIHMKSSRAMPLLEKSASQLEQVLNAASQVDGFMPYQHSFEGGELILDGSFLFNSLIRPYVQAAAELANYNLPAARILADRLPLAEARLMAELLVARSALGEPAISPPGSRFREFVMLN